MLYMPKTRIREAYEWPVNSGASTIFEGQVLVNSVQNGVAAVLQSSGANTDVWAGVAFNVWQVGTTAKYVDVITVPSGSPYTATLSNTPVSPSTTMSAVTLDGSTSVLAYNSGVASGQFSVSGNVITFNSAQAGNVYYVTYTYTLSTQQAISYYGDGFVLKRSPSSITNTTGVIRAGLVYTDQYDASVNWYAPNILTIKTGANGLFTIGGSGTSLTWCTVFEAPTNSFPFLGLYINT
jgi:hypothetical protein